ncbi:hypothetical protein NDU88_008264 [Pleurodeles waltl]|uniref:Uncharacterized protein n=1 Tax=Pleurodeles waltl TaxID=8319 RepID=A0AAV7N4F9_PLEWA|nr:hypothetical protein NDU88_008264 [Pleurodeles waltl]
MSSHRAFSRVCDVTAHGARDESPGPVPARHFRRELEGRAEGSRAPPQQPEQARRHPTSHLIVTGGSSGVCLARGVVKDDIQEESAAQSHYSRRFRGR